MTEKFIGYTEYFSDEQSLFAAIDEAVGMWRKNGSQKGQTMGAYDYLGNEECQHAMTVFEEYGTARFALFINTEGKPTGIRAAVEIDPDRFSEEALRRIICAPGTDMSDDDKELLARLDRGERL